MVKYVVRESVRNSRMTTRFRREDLTNDLTARPSFQSGREDLAEHVLGSSKYPATARHVYNYIPVTLFKIIIYGKRQAHILEGIQLP